MPTNNMQDFMQIIKNGNPQEIIKILDSYLKPRSKKW